MPNSMNSFFTPEQIRAAAQSLAVPSTWEIFFIATHVDLLHEERQDAIEEDYGELGYLTDDTVTEIITKHLRSIELPPGWRLIGMQPQGGGGPRFGIVDFSALGAA